MARFWMIVNLIFGRNIVVYKSDTNEVLLVIGTECELKLHRCDYAFMSKEDMILGDGEKLYYNDQK